MGTFGRCTALESVTIPNATHIGKYAFNGCSSLKSVSVQNGAVEIAEGAFLNEPAVQGHELYNLNNLETVIIPHAVSIGRYAFYNCFNLKTVTLQSGLQDIGEDAFYGCGSLVGINIPDGVKSIGAEAFAHSGLVTVTIPNSVTFVKARTFFESPWLESATLSNNCAEIAGEMFFGCTALTSVVIPDSVTRIGQGAFANSGISGIYIPNSVTEIDGYAFRASNITEISIPSGIAEIYERTFEDCQYLVTVAIPKSVISINGSAFNDCPNISDVYYGGTEEEWQEIQFAGGNTNLLSATIHYNSGNQ